MKLMRLSVVRGSLSDGMRGECEGFGRHVYHRLSVERRRRCEIK
jgi:hypothetical protein